MLADPPIPVILPIESNPDLDVRDNSRTYSPLIRLVPTDDLQAEEAVNFVEEFGAKRIWVIEDTQLNPKYTQYIAAEFIKLIQDRYDRKRYLANCEERARSVSYDCKKMGIESFSRRGCAQNEFVESSTLKLSPISGHRLCVFCWTRRKLPIGH